MNILIYRLSDQAVYCRPDTTLQRTGEPYYIPESVKCLYKTPVVYVRICRAGKCVGEKFAERYYDKAYLGGLLYAGNPADAHTIAFGNNYDKSSYIYAYGPEFGESKDPEEGWKKAAEKGVDRALVARAIATVSAKQSLRLGDLLAIEYGCATELTLKDKDYIEIEFGDC